MGWTSGAGTPGTGPPGPAGTVPIPGRPGSYSRCPRRSSLRGGYAITLRQLLSRPAVLGRTRYAYAGGIDRAGPSAGAAVSPAPACRALISPSRYASASGLKADTSRPSGSSTTYRSSSSAPASHLSPSGVAPAGVVG